MGILVSENEISLQTAVPDPVGWAGRAMPVQAVPSVLYSKTKVVMSDAAALL